jgi:hypothetical protein
MNRDASLQPSLLDPLLCQNLLLRTERERIHRTPSQLHTTDGHTSPTTSDLQYASARGDLGFVNDMIQFRVLGGLEGVGR